MITFTTTLVIDYYLHHNLALREVQLALNDIDSLFFSYF